MISHGSSAVLTLHRYNEKNVDDPSIQCKAQIRNMPPKMTFSLLLDKAEKDYTAFPTQHIAIDYLQYLVL